MKKLNENGICKIKSYLSNIGLFNCKSDDINNDKIQLKIEHIAELAKIGIITESAGDNSYFCYNMSSLLAENLDEIEPDRISQDKRRDEKKEFEALVIKLLEIFPTKDQIKNVLNDIKNNMVLKSDIADILK